MIKNQNSFKNDNGVSANKSSREARIQAIREAIQAGTYRIDNRTLANSLLIGLVQEQWEKISIKRR